MAPTNEMLQIAIMTKPNKYTSDSYENFFDKNLSVTDPDLYNSIKLELERQQQHIELIASENIVSKAVLDAQGSIMTNKYAEGYPAKRYYGGCEFVDKAEDLALERVKNYLILNMLMYNLTLALKQMVQYILRF